MTPVIILGAIVFVPAVLLLFFRISAPIVFLSLCVGSVLMEHVADDLHVVTEAFTAHAPNAVTDASTEKLILLAIPTVLTMLFMIRTVRKSHGHLLANLIPALGVGFLAASLAVPNLPADLSLQIMQTTFWTQAKDYQGYVIALTATASLILVWMQHPRHGAHKEEKHGKHHKSH